MPIHFHNKSTGEHGSAMVQTNDPRAVSKNPADREVWLTNVRRKFAEEHGCQVEDVVIRLAAEGSTRQRTYETHTHTPPKTPSGPMVLASLGPVLISHQHSRPLKTETALANVDCVAFYFGEQTLPVIP